MHADAESWVAGAEGDFIGASTLVKKRSDKVAHLTCFAAQQSAEKSMIPLFHDSSVSLVIRCFSRHDSLDFVCMSSQEKFQLRPPRCPYDLRTDSAIHNNYPKLSKKGMTQ